MRTISRRDALWRGLIPPVLASTFTSGCRNSSGDTSAQQRSIPVRMVLAGARSGLSYLPHQLAEVLGFCRDEGLNVSIDYVSGGTKSAQALIGGSADVVAGYYADTLRTAAEGRRACAFINMFRFPGMVLFASPASRRRLRQISDLRGALVGVTDLGANSHVFVQSLLVRNGVPSTEFKPVAIGVQASALAALEHGKIEAGVLFEPAATYIQRRRPGILALADTRTEAGVQAVLGAAEYPGAVLYSTSEWLTRNSEVARRFGRALQTALSWANKHTPRDIVGAIPADRRPANDDGAFLEAVTNVQHMLSEDGRMTAEAAAAVRDMLASSLDRSRLGSTDLSATWTNQFVPADR